MMLITVITLIVAAIIFAHNDIIQHHWLLSSKSLMVIDPMEWLARRGRAGQQQASLLCQAEHRLEEAHLLPTITCSLCWEVSPALSSETSLARPHTSPFVALATQTRIRSHSTLPSPNLPPLPPPEFLHCLLISIEAGGNLKEVAVLIRWV